MKPRPAGAGKKHNPEASLRIVGRPFRVSFSDRILQFSVVVRSIAIAFPLNQQEIQMDDELDMPKLQSPF